MFTPLSTPGGEHSLLFRRTVGIASSLVDKIHPCGPTSLLRVTICPWGQNWKTAPQVLKILRSRTGIAWTKLGHVVTEISFFKSYADELGLALQVPEQKYVSWSIWSFLGIKWILWKIGEILILFDFLPDEAFRQKFSYFRQSGYSFRKCPQYLYRSIWYYTSSYLFAVLL
jgi:hypothetical protein